MNLKRRVDRLTVDLRPRCQQCGRFLCCTRCDVPETGLDWAQLTTEELLTMRNLLDKVTPAEETSE